jgi:Caspase domain
LLPFDRDTNNRYIARMPVERYASEYNMNHVNRGHAVIFNHENFEIPSLKSRAGTRVDCENLIETLQGLNFDVKVYTDLKLKQIRDKVDELSQLDHSTNDCVVVCILSHGELGYIYAKDVQYKLDSVWGSFTANHCPSLAGKPKLFFIQACQGDMLDGGVVLHNRTETDSGGSQMSYKIPIHADFLIA